jgi:hypothetical protein
VRNIDKFLVAIVAGVVLLIGVTFAVVFLKPKPTYQAEDTPEGVAHNYLLALQNEDYERAYSYLSQTLPGYPADISEFTQSIENYSWYFRLGTDTTIAIDSAEIVDTRAVVMVRETRFYDHGLFESSTHFSTFEMELQKVNEQWRIVDSDNYFVRCWNYEDGCRY